MKSFATSSFSALTSLFLVLFNVATFSNYSGSVQAAALRRDGLPPINVPLDLVPKYFELMDKCNEGGDDAYMAVLYEGGEEIVYQSGTCASRKLDDEHPGQLVVFCKEAQCDFYPKYDCSGAKILPVSVPFLPGTPVVNPLDLTAVLAGGAICKVA